MLPLSLDQAPLLQVAQQRVDRVRVDRDDAVGDRLDLLDQAVAVGGLAGDQVQDEQREDVAAADLAAEHVHRAGAAPGWRPGLAGAARALAARAASASLRASRLSLFALAGHAARL